MDDEKLSDREALRFLLRESGSRHLAMLAILMIGASLTEGFGLLLLVPITQMVAGEREVPLDPAWLERLVDLPLGLLLIGVVVLVSIRAGVSYLANEARRSLGLRLGRKLRLMAHRAILGADWRWLSRQHSADHAALIMGEADRVAALANQALVMLTAGITLAILIGSSALISLPFTAAVVGAGALVGLGLALLRARDAQDGQAYVSAYTSMQRLVSNALQHLRAARIANAESILASDFASASNELSEVELRYFRAGHRTQMLFQIAAACALAALVYAALDLFALPLSVFLPVVAISARTVPLVGSIQQAWRGWRYNLPALDSLTTMIAQATDHREPPRIAPDPVQMKQSIALRDVTLRYEGRENPVLDGFSLDIPKGSIIGITGPSGSGKSTLADLLSGLMAADEGSLQIDAQPLGAAERVRWRRQVAYVEQSQFLLDATIAENLAWGMGEVPEEELLASLDGASAGFVRELPDGLATPMGEAGRQFSGGEKQRIAMARALLRDPDLLILDEVTSALDLENASAILETVERLRGSCTILVLGHDPRLLAMADQVVTLGAVDGSSARRRGRDAA